MIESSVREAFGLTDDFSVHKLSTGLINHTYKIGIPNGDALLLQQINTKVFSQPMIIQTNYQKIQKHLASNDSYILPQIIKTSKGDLIHTHEHNVWRCFEFIKDTYSPTTSSTDKEAWTVANCFGNFSAKLSDLNASSIAVVLPGFHDLALRYHQFEAALKLASTTRKNAAKSLINAATEHKAFVSFYGEIIKKNQSFPLHILHHDCKIANILFKEETNELYSPIDLDTTQPGLFFSDMGDMIRSMVPNLPEGHQNVSDLALRHDFYQAIREGYLDSMKDNLTNEEHENIDMAGKIIVYMQALRFLTDYLNNDVYYQIDYAEQNKDRAANQFQLLKLLVDYVKNSLPKRKQYSC